MLTTTTSEAHLFSTRSFLPKYKAPYIMGRSMLPMTDEPTRRSLVVKYQTTKDRKVMDTIIRTNLRLVFSRIKKWQRAIVNEDDLLNEGLLGLITAVERYDTNRDVNFGTYAVPWIDAKLYRYCEENNGLTAVRRPCWNFNTKYWEDLNEHRDISLDDAPRSARQLGMRTAEPRKNLIPDERPLAEEEVERLQNDKEAKATLVGLFEKLSVRERDVMMMRFLENMTLEEIGQKFGVTRERIRQIEHAALVRVLKKLGNPRPIKDVHVSLFDWFHTERTLAAGP